jgi:hypothetical protein
VAHRVAFRYATTPHPIRGKCREQTDGSDAALVFDHDRDGVDQILADDP